MLDPLFLEMLFKTYFKPLLFVNFLFFFIKKKNTLPFWSAEDCIRLFVPTTPTPFQKERKKEKKDNSPRDQPAKFYSFKFKKVFGGAEWPTPSQKAFPRHCWFICLVRSSLRSISLH